MSGRLGNEVEKRPISNRTKLKFKFQLLKLIHTYIHIGWLRFLKHLKPNVIILV